MEFIETAVFTKRITEILTDNEYRSLQEKLVENPKVGKLIPQGKVCENIDGLFRAGEKAAE